MSNDLSDPVYSSLVAARIKFLLEKPFIGQVVSHLKLIEAPWCNTAATDGKHFYWGREFIKGLSKPRLLFLVAHEGLHCFPAGTIIPGAFKPIEDYDVGDHVIGVGGAHSKVVMPMSRHYEGDMITIKARGMLPVPVTPEHPILVSRPRWKTVEDKGDGKRGNIRVWTEPTFVKAGEVKRGDWVQVPRVEGNVTNHLMEFHFTGNPWSSPEKMRAGVALDADVAEFLGYYVAEGSTSITNGDYISLLVFDINERPIAARLRLLLIERFGIAASIQEIPEGNTCRLQFSSKPFGRWLRENCGSGAHHIHIPSVVLYNSDMDVLAAFLRGYTDGDGCTGEYGVNSATVSKVLVLQLQIAWARFGVMYNLTSATNTPALIKGKIISGSLIYRGGTARNYALEILGKQPVAKNRPIMCAAVMDGAILTPVTKVTPAPFSGMVYNIETSCHTYAAGNMTTHNCVFDHVGRRGNRDKDLWNMAADLMINYFLVHAKIGEMPPCGLYDPAYTDQMTVDEIYDLLKKNCVTIKMPLDMHLDIGEDSGEDGDGSEGPGDGKSTSVTIVGKDGPPKISKDDMQKIRNDMKAVIIAAAQSPGAGNLPAGIKKMIGVLLEPQMDWRSMLDAFHRSSVKDDYTYNRISRRTWSCGVILPAQDVVNKLDVWCAIDASGSTTPEMVTDFLSETKGIATSFRDYCIHVLTYDTEVYNVQEFTPANINDIDEYEVIGNGGTAFECIYEYLKREGIVPARLVNFTDGLPNSSWGDEGYCSTLFVIHSNPRILPPFGAHAHYDPKVKH